MYRFDDKMIFVAILCSLWVPTLLIAFFQGDSQTFGAFLLSFIFSVTVLSAIAIIFLRYDSADFRLAPSVRIFCFWLIMGVIYATPIIALHYARAGEWRFLDSLFDSYAALTTTGSADFISQYQNSKTMIFWLAMVQWQGAAFTIGSFLIMAINKNAPQNEIKWMVFAKIYLLLSLIVFITFLLAQVPWFEAIILSSTVISTGGILPYNISIFSAFGGFTSLIFVSYLLFFSMPVFVILHSVFKGAGGSLQNIKWMNFLKITLLVCFIILMFNFFEAIYLGRDNPKNFIARTVALISIVTTSGVPIFSFETTLPIYWGIIFILAFSGMHKGSTTAGLKMQNIRLLCNMIIIEINKTRYLYRYESIIKNANSGFTYAFANFFGLLLLVAIGSIALSLEGEKAFSSILIALGYLVNSINLPDYAGLVSEVNVQDYHIITKKLLILMMIIGRLEVVAVIVCLMSCCRKDAYV